MEQQQWFVMNAYKAEQKAEEHLHQAGDIQYFIPKHYVLRNHNGRKERRYVPLIPNMVFVRARYARLEEFKRNHPYLRYATRKVEGTNRIMKVPDKEMEDFIRVTREREDAVRYFRPEEIDLRQGVKVRIHGGSLDGVVGTLMKVKGARSRELVLMLEDLVAMSVRVEPDFIEVLS